ncbi:XdhC family protein, partial [Cyanobacteria bacterium FACHB-63]|nr:XdhC family protein [Cyanobacteria bacterium FACHB-63]
MLNCYRQLLEKMPAVLATVMQVKGSVPREVGA